MKNTQDAEQFFETFREVRKEIAGENGYHLADAIMKTFDRWNLAQIPHYCKTDVIASASRDDFKTIGFKEMTHYTVMNSLLYDLGRGRYLRIGCLGTPNEMLFIAQIDNDDNKKVTDVIVLKNYDYDGYTKIADVKTIITLITGRVF